MHFCHFLQKPYEPMDGPTDVPNKTKAAIGDKRYHSRLLLCRLSSLICKRYSRDHCDLWALYSPYDNVQHIVNLLYYILYYIVNLL